MDYLLFELKNDKDRVKISRDDKFIEVSLETGAIDILTLPKYKRDELWLIA